MLFNVLQHLSQLLVGAALTSNRSFHPTSQHIPSLMCSLLLRFYCLTHSQNFHFIIHFALCASILNLLLVLLLVNGGVGPLEVPLEEGDALLDRPIL